MGWRAAVCSPREPDHGKTPRRLDVKKTIAKTNKLSLNKETLRRLADADLRGVQGGWIVPTTTQTHAGTCITHGNCA
jgi:hypothetical protein